MLLVGLFAAGLPGIHMRGAHYGEPRKPKHVLLSANHDVLAAEIAVKTT